MGAHEVPRGAYAFAAWLPLAVRQDVIVADFSRLSRFDGRRTTPSGACPFGVALGRGGAIGAGAPTANVVAATLVSELDDPAGYATVARSVGRFIAGWDRGDITPNDLPRIFGVTAEAMGDGA